ncbi:MAG TPA: aldehyde dehydrogenase [Legionellales bacterium]|nr:aldehyde dehydrogenase [Legionellales bacterium]
MASPEIQKYLEKLKKLNIETKAFINGQYQKNHQQSFACLRPMDGQLITEVTQTSQEQVHQAVASAKQAFYSGVWSQAQATHRKNILMQWASLLEKHAEEIILLESLDSGKLLTDIKNIDFPASVEYLRWFAELCDKINNQQIPVEPNLLALVAREPIGVVGAIIPWNYPLLMAMWKIAPALAAGNSVILKPSEKSPLSAIRMASLAKAAGIPDGVFQVLPGDGVVGGYLSRHPEVDCISFTGSTKTGKQILKDSAETNLKKVWLELGGKSAQVILKDYKNLNHVAETVAQTIFSNAGQVCDAGSRVVIHRSIKEQFVDLLLPIAKTYQPKHPFDPRAKMGPVIDEKQMKNILYDIEKAKRESSLILGGQQTLIDTGGFYIEPTIFDCPHSELYHTQKEIFGPVLSIISFDDIDEAIAIANSTTYGLAAGIWSDSFKNIYEISKKIQVGTVWGNCYDACGNLNLPFGGFKQSGNSKDKSIQAYYKYTELKNIVIEL